MDFIFYINDRPNIVFCQDYSKHIPLNFTKKIWYEFYLDHFC